MTTKYDKYIIRKPAKKEDIGSAIEFSGELDYKTNFSIMVVKIAKPTLMEEYPHFHDYDMYLYFLPLDPDETNELGAEIEIGLGEESERHIITTSTSVYIPKGMIHCPLNFKRVDKPILFMHPFFSPSYIRTDIRPDSK